MSASLIVLVINAIAALMLSLDGSMFGAFSIFSSICSWNFSQFVFGFVVFSKIVLVGLNCSLSSICTGR